MSEVPEAKFQVLGIISPPTSIILDPYPQGVYRIISLHRPPPATVVDLCCGKARWTYWIERIGGYKVVLCDKRRRSRAHVQCDLRFPPFRDGVFDVVMADLPYPFYKGKAYGPPCKSVKEYSNLLLSVGHTSHQLLRDDGILVVKTSDFWKSNVMIPGLWIVHEVLRGLFKAVDVAVLFLKTLIYSPGQYRRALRCHNYLVVYRKRREVGHLYSSTTNS